jgi:hypothetical protein
VPWATRRHWALAVGRIKQSEPWCSLCIGAYSGEGAPSPSSVSASTAAFPHQKTGMGCTLPSGGSGGVPSHSVTVLLSGGGKPSCFLRNIFFFFN